MSQRRKLDSTFKARVALEAIREELTMAEISGKFQVHPTQITHWKKHAIQGLPQIFGDKREKTQQDSDATIAELYRQIGELKVEGDWLKKKSEQLLWPRKGK